MYNKLQKIYQKDRFKKLKNLNNLEQFKINKSKNFIIRQRKK